MHNVIPPYRHIVKINSLMFLKHSDAEITRATEVLSRKLITLASKLALNDVQLQEEEVT